MWVGLTGLEFKNERRVAKSTRPAMFFSQRKRMGIFSVKIHYLSGYLHISLQLLSGIMGRWMPENARWTRFHFAGRGYVIETR